MTLCRRMLFAVAMCLMAPPAWAQSAGAERDSGAFILQDFIGRAWRNERVRFAASAAQFQDALASMSLVGPDRKPVLYQIGGDLPRLKSEAPSVVMPLAEGKGVRIETAAGADFVFVSASPFSYRDNDIAFAGTTGLVRVHGGRAQISLSAPRAASAPSARL